MLIGGQHRRVGVGERDGGVVNERDAEEQELTGGMAVEKDMVVMTQPTLWRTRFNISSRDRALCTDSTSFQFDSEYY